MVRMTTDGGANPKPGPAGWRIRQNRKSICLWKHYENASNNVMELSAVIAGLTFLPPGMAIWLSTDSQYVQNGINEWMPKWKRHGWRNSKKAGVSNKSLWLALETAIARHRCIEFTWVKAHSGLLHNEIADTLATRGVKGSSYGPTDWFDKLPPDTEEEDDVSIPISEVITHRDEFGADEEQLPSSGTRATVYGFNAEEAAEAVEVAEATMLAEAEKTREREFRHFAHEVLDISSRSVTEDEDFRTEVDAVVISSGMTLVDGADAFPEPQDEEGFQFQEGRVGPVAIPESIAPHAWSSTWAQARAEAEQRRAAEERFS
jgi:ribonuclease HI